MWRGVGFIRQTKLMLVRFVRLRGLPEEIAKGVALGIFIGMTPTFGFQMAIALLFAYLLRENRLAAILGVWVTNPVDGAGHLCGRIRDGTSAAGHAPGIAADRVYLERLRRSRLEYHVPALGWRYHRRDHSRLTGLFRDSAHGADRQELARATLATPTVASEVQEPERGIARRGTSDVNTTSKLGVRPAPSRAFCIWIWSFRVPMSIVLENVSVRTFCVISMCWTAS